MKKLKVMTFNMRYNTADDGDHAWPYRVESAVELFKKHKPVIVGTQEGLIGMLTDIQQSLPEYAWIGQARMDEADEYCAIFYNNNEVNLKDHGQFWLSETPELPSISWNSACPRICTWACFERINEPDIRFMVYNIHLDHISQEAREKGSALVWKHIKQQIEDHPMPVLLTGDFNSEPGNKAIRFFQGQATIDGVKGELTDAYSTMKQPVGGTYHGFMGGEKGEPIDYIFVSPGVPIGEVTIDREQLKGKYPSDHYPLIATIGL